MAVTQIKEIAKSRDGSVRSDGSKRHRRIVRVWTDDPADNDMTVSAAVALEPGFTPSDAFPGDAASFPKEYRATQEHEMLIWLCDIEYTNEEDNPLNEPADLEVGGQLFSEPMLIDANGDPVANSAGFPIVDPPIERDRARGIITFSKNVATPPSWVFSLQNSLNQSGFSIWSGAISVAAEKAKFREPRISGPREKNGVTYYTVSGTIEVDPDGWKAKALDQGWAAIDPNDATKRVVVANDDGTEPSQMWPLDGAGRPLVNPSIGTIVVLEFDRYLASSWAALVALLT